MPDLFRIASGHHVSFPRGSCGQETVCPLPGAYSECIINAQYTAHKVGSAKQGSQTGTQWSGGPVGRARLWSLPSEAGIGQLRVCGADSPGDTEEQTPSLGRGAGGPGAGHPRSPCVPPTSQTRFSPQNHSISWQGQGKQHANAELSSSFFFLLANIFL